MKKTLLLLAGVSALCIAYAQGPITLFEICPAPKIDGIVDGNDPWNKAGHHWINMTKNKPTNTTNDVTGKFQLAFDNIGLYVAVVCTGDSSVDTASITTPNSMENDCVEVYVKLDTASGETGEYIPGDFVFRMRRGSVFPDRFDPGQLFVNWKNDNNFKIAQVDEGFQYTQEWQIPWILLYESAEGVFWDKYFKFDIKITDNTTGKASGCTQQLLWNSESDEQWHNTKYLGLVTMVIPVKKSAYFDENNSTDPDGLSDCFGDIKKSDISEIEISPIPVESDIDIDIPLKLLGSKIHILNTKGQLVYADILKSTSNTISLKPLKQGIYFVKITGANGTAVKKIVKN